MSFLRVASVGLVVLGSACGSFEDEASTTDVEQQIGCPIWMCGTNSPEIDHMGIHDLHQGGKANENGFRVFDVRRSGIGGWKIDVERAQFVARKGFAEVRGTKLVGTSIMVKNDYTSDIYEIQIQAVARTTMYWAQLTGTEWTESYVLQWDYSLAGDQKRNWKPICTNAPGDNSPDLMGMNAFHTVMFEDDLVRADKKTVEKRDLTEDDGWFNFGCAGHALAKLHLTGHTAGAQNQWGFHTTVDDRTSSLKMIVGDYCGTGFPFTVAGQPLEWLDANGWMDYSAGFAGKPEARWYEGGARCLDEPRVLANPTPDGIATFPTLLDDIKAECGGSLPPSCKDGDPYNFDGMHIVSANP